MPFIAALLVFVGFFFLYPFVPFPPLPGPDPCAGVSSSVRSICQSYCTVENCDEQDRFRAVCRKLRFQFVRTTGHHYFPCELRRPATRTPTEIVAVDTPTATSTAEPIATDTPIEVETETPTPTFTPIETITATSTPEGLAAE